MTVNRGPGVAPIAGVGTTTLEHRLQLAGQYAENAPGVPRSGVLAQATDLLVVGKLDMSYDVDPAALVISRTAGEGVYTPTMTGTTNVATSAAPGTNSRWDLIYVKQNDQAKGDADNAAVIGVQEGTAAASPTKPTADLPSGAYVLAEARIFAGTTGTSGGSNTVAQVWRHTAARGAPIRVRDTTERAEITAPASGQEVVRLDLPGKPKDRWDGTAWGLGDGGRHAEFTFDTPASSIPSATDWGPGALTLDTGAVTTDSSVVSSPASNQIRLNKGTYAIWFGGAFGTPLNGSSYFQLLNPDNSVIATGACVEFWGSVAVPNFRVTADNTTLTLRFKWTFAGGPTNAAGRVRVTRIG